MRKEGPDDNPVSLFLINISYNYLSLKKNLETNMFDLHGRY